GNFLALLGALALALCACPHPPPEPGPCGVPFWGQSDAGARIEIGQLGSDRDFVELHDGDPVDLRFPTQGGHVIYIAARVHNMSGCRAALRATLRDPTGVNSEVFEARSIDFVVDSDGGGLPDLS